MGKVGTGTRHVIIYAFVPKAKIVNSETPSLRIHARVVDNLSRASY
jgi:hypothetical protein